MAAAEVVVVLSELSLMVAVVEAAARARVNKVSTSSIQTTAGQSTIEHRKK